LANTRVVYGDLILSFTIGANTDPSATTAAAWITDLYKDCYKAGYGNMNLYAATDTGIDEKVYDAFNYIVKSAAQRIFEEISESYRVGSTTKRPIIKLDDSEIQQCCAAVGWGFRMSSHEDEDLDQVGDGL